MTESMTGDKCPSCGDGNVRAFYEVTDVPLNSVILLESRGEALDFPRGDVRLGFCGGCGFVYNTRFDAERVEYSSRCEETQGYSPTFQRWHRALAERLVQRHDLVDKKIIEIGCGKGEFLALLCELGPNRGVGFDPAFVPGRLSEANRDRMEFIADYYSERYAGVSGDFVCCKMTLEHIPDAGAFVSMVRRAIGDRDVGVFFQVPNAERILEDVAFWDVYYEHCSYFTAASLRALFERSGFEVQMVETEYEGQYLTLEARPRTLGAGAEDGARGEAREDRHAEREEEVNRLRGLVGAFEDRITTQRAAWAERLQARRAAGQRVVVWGSGSKGVSFLTTVPGTEAIEHVVDINPHRHGYFMPTTGQEIVSPDFLTTYPPDVVVVMNPIYREEILSDLNERGLRPEVWSA